MLPSQEIHPRLVECVARAQTRISERDTPTQGVGRSGIPRPACESHDPVRAERTDRQMETQNLPGARIEENPPRHPRTPVRETQPRPEHGHVGSVAADHRTVSPLRQTHQASAGQGNLPVRLLRLHGQARPTRRGEHDHPRTASTHPSGTLPGLERPRRTIRFDLNAPRTGRS